MLMEIFTPTVVISNIDLVHIHSSLDADEPDKAEDGNAAFCTDSSMHLRNVCLCKHESFAVWGPDSENGLQWQVVRQSVCRVAFQNGRSHEGSLIKPGVNYRRSR